MAKSDAAQIVFTAGVTSVKTMADGGLRVAFDLSEQSIPQAAMLMDCKRQGIPLEITCVVASLTNLDDETKKGTERKTIRVGRARA